MSFYLDDYPEEDQTDLCPHCSGRDFYPDPISGTLTCSSCYTQSQSQHEEIDIDEGLGLAAMKRTKNVYKSKGGNGGKGGKVARDLTEYDSSKKLPDAECCCLAFQWLLLDASRCIMNLTGMSEQRKQNEYPDHYKEDSNHSILEVTVKRIWFAYLHTWTKAAQHYAKQYPEMRVSFRDLFLSETRRSIIVQHLSITVGKRVEDEMIHEMQMKLQSEDLNKYQGNGNKSTASSDTNNTLPSKSNKSAGVSKKQNKGRQLIFSIPKLCSQVFKSKRMRVRHRLPNGRYCLDPYKAVLCIQPSLTLLLSILQLALMHLKTGYAAYHVTSWVVNGLLPHALNGYALLPMELREKATMVKKFFIRSFVPPADVVDNLAFLLANSIGWLRDTSNGTTDENAKLAVQDIRSKRKRNLSHASRRNYLETIHNVPLLTARMVMDLGFDRRVLDNALALMGLNSEISSTAHNANTRDDSRQINIILSTAAPSQLYTPLHVAAVIVVACKLCQCWEGWAINNLHSTKKSKFVPWNDSLSELLGNGPTLDHYVDFLNSTALNGLDCSYKMSHFFRTVDEKIAEHKEILHEGLAPTPQLTVAPNTLLSCVPIRNKQSKFQARVNSPVYNDRYITSKLNQTVQDQNPNYVLLIEYVCYTIEETNPAKLHDLVLMFEDELLTYQK